MKNNRKERRLAAKTGSNRRVKLDLLADPSGDFGDSTNKEDVGGGDNARSNAGSPDSPSSSEFRHFIKSSGQRPENPLLLLGQYSDEEAEEVSGKDVNHDTRKESSAELDEQVKVGDHENTGAVEDENLITEDVDEENMQRSSSMDVLPASEGNGVTEDDKTESPHKFTDAVEQPSVSFASDTQTTGAVDIGWKMVLHEESNSYYYWNTVTGETSWEVPAVLTQGSGLAYDPKTGPEVEETPVTSVDTQPYNGSTNGMVCEATEIGGSKPDVEVYNKGKYTDIMAIEKDASNHVNTVDGENMPGSYDVNYGFSRGGFGALSNGEAHLMDYNCQAMSGHVYPGTGGDLSSDSFRLLQLGEYLSERLKSLNGTEGGTDQRLKWRCELDIRVADIKSLVPYGSSLLPFWLHSENQLKKLEAAINNEVLKSSQLENIGQMYEAGSRLPEDISETANKKNPLASMESDSPDQSNVSKETDIVASGAPVAIPKDSSPIVEALENTVQADTIPNVPPHSVEDVDMDVEMEVEDESRIQNGAQLDQFILSISPAQHEYFGSKEEDLPPLPNDEWIPPPPPDDEPLPPPPPEEPSETPFPPTPSETQGVQAYSYGEQYTYAYPGSGFEYYGQTNTLTSEAATNGYYVDANGCQVAAPLPNLYYAAVPNPYPGATGEPMTYYTLQEGSIPIAPVIGGVETSDKKESSAAVASFSVSTYVPATSTVTSSVSVMSAPAVATTVAPAESVPKLQPKVTRTKKRTLAAAPSLRSNKKVSGLVDKWKAVKEELHEDEEDDEPEDALEALEKKRQREIEQWRAQQIATGEAKDNANFQPLGGDWRERVRRKRAKKSKEAEENLPMANDDTKPQPDLAELTKQLPSGWQAYWDEASKEVYYGNSKTSETTWIKPTI